MSRLLALVPFAVLVLAAEASAHFPWLAADDAGRPILFFGESLAQRDYHLPAAVEKAPVVAVGVDGKTKPVSLSLLEEEGFIGRRASGPVGEALGLESEIVYGVYHGTKLTYYVQHDLAFDDNPVKRSDDPLDLRVEVVATDGGGAKALVLWQGKPLADAEVKLFCEEGHEEGSAKTDADGLVEFSAELIEPGVNALMVGHTVKDVKGEIDGSEYGSESHYLTATFTSIASDAEEGAGDAEAGNDEQASDLPLLPKPIASFGAAVSDGWVYVYSGHTGKAHAHSRDNLSNHFVRVKLEGGAAAEPLPIDQPLQGLPLVAHGGKLYRVGGLDAHNKSGEEEDIHSTDTFARFDPESKAWTKLPPLPERRSSHDAVVVGDQLYVLGGWTLSGTSDGDWLENAWRCDLTAPEKGWEKAAAQPFRRRAIAASHLDGKVLVLGGMDEDTSISGRVDALDPKTGEWSRLADLPGEDWSGFGVSAWNRQGVLYACGMEGILYKLESLDGEWKEAGKLGTPRFFHRLLPAGDDRLLVIGGATPKQGHQATSEFVTVQ